MISIAEIRERRDKWQQKYDGQHAEHRKEINRIKSEAAIAAGRAANDLDHARRQAKVKEAALLASVASSRAVSKFAARVAPLISELYVRSKKLDDKDPIIETVLKLFSEVENCTAHRFAEEEKLRDEFQNDLQVAFLEMAK
jgi:hypothetical protein